MNRRSDRRGYDKNRGGVIGTVDSYYRKEENNTCIVGSSA